MAKPKRYDLKGPFNDEIQAKIRQMGWTKPEQFADHYGIGRTTVYSLILGRQTSEGQWIKPSLDTIIRLSLALNTPIDELVQKLYPEVVLPHPKSAPITSVAIKVVGRVGAGPGQDAPIENGVVYVTPKLAKGKDLEAYQVVGDSMCGGKRPICDGDTIVVNRHDKGTSGSAVVALLNDGTHVCKAYKEDRFGKRLMSLNPLYTNTTPPMIPADQVKRIIGKVVWVQGAVENLED